MEYINFNGKTVPAETPLFGAESRGLKFGDGLFETMCYRDGAVVLWNKHLQRFFQGLQKLNFEVGRLLTEVSLKEQVDSLLKKNNYDHARVRLTAFRKAGGLFDISSLQPDYIIQTWPLEDDFGSFNQNGLQMDFFYAGKKSCDQFSNLKHNNYLLPVMASFFAKENKLNDAIVLNTHGRICETTNANIFLVKNEVIITPPLHEGCVAGTMRSFLLEVLPIIGCRVEEKLITIDSLLEADEVFITNALRPIRWVSQIHESRYPNAFTTDLVKKLQANYPAYFKL